MRLKVSVFFKVNIFDRQFLLRREIIPFTKATVTDQGLDRMGDSSWISGIHLGSNSDGFTEASSGLTGFLHYFDKIAEEKSDTIVGNEFASYIREMVYKVPYENFKGNLTQLSLSWDSDERTAVALANLGESLSLTEREEFEIFCRVEISQSLTEEVEGIIDLGASEHNFIIKPSAIGTLKDFYIGSKIGQSKGKIYGGAVPKDPKQEPSEGIDTNVATFKIYEYDSRSRGFVNTFLISSRNADTKSIVSQTLGLPSSYAVEFTPAISRGDNRELELEFLINWSR